MATPIFAGAGAAGRASLAPDMRGPGDVFAAFIVIIATVLGFDLLRTWWNTNEWRRRPRRKRRLAR